MAAPRPSRASAQIGEICSAVTDLRTLRLQVLDVLSEIVPHDAFVWLLTDPETTVGSAPIADVPCLPRLPEGIRLKYLTEVNRWTTITGSVARLHDVTAGDLSRSRLWSELLAEYDVSDVVSVVFVDDYGCWGFLDLWRVGDRPRFSRNEEDLLVTIVPELTAALRRLQALSFLAAKPADVPASHEGGPVVMLLSQDSRCCRRRRRPRPTSARSCRPRRVAVPCPPRRTTSLLSCSRSRPASTTTLL